MRPSRPLTRGATPGPRAGRHSGPLPERLAARYQEAREDPELLALRDEVALVDVRINGLLARLGTGEAGAAWKALRAALAEHRALRAALEDGRASVVFERMAALIERGAADEATWAEIRELIDDRRRLVESERKRLVEMQQMLTVEQAMGLASALAEAVRRHVTDTAVLGAVQLELAGLLGVDPAAALGEAEAPD